MKLDKTIKFPVQDLGPASGNTPYKGQRPFSSSDGVISFPDGIPAFEESKRFVLVVNDSIKPFVQLKSLDIKDLGFICVDPFIVCPNYSVSLSAMHLSLLQIKDPSVALVLSFVTISADCRDTTCNLLAPVIINIDKFIGSQVILEGQPVKFRIWEAIESIQSSSANKGG